jgi:hypothetical protein
MGNERLALMGYSQEELLTAVERIRPSWGRLIDDSYHLIRGKFFSVGEPVLWINKWRNFRRGYPSIQHL